ncbi:SpaA isopeptide-forming pilin-related protein [Nocardioides sp.]|uniref:SpaA isopeptide-forming pilin-related protein n=1 Tax=Nocardioides sp. TaxID=35761 RepID=UPI00261CA0FF|nr:SpaA isopeptide-forming pilin-related protein [Nocardioides sp.]
MAGTVTGALTVGMMMWGAPAHAAGEALTVTLSQTTGTAPFDTTAGATDTNGLDLNDSNDVVRTNDTVTYNVGVRYEGGAQTNPTITFTLPRGEELTSLPAWCKSGSSVTPASLPAPTVPVTATSWTTLPQQTVVCIVAGETQGTSRNYPFISKVRPEVPNNTVLGPVSANVTSDQVTAAVTTPTVQHTVSSAPRVDLSKRLASTSNTSGPVGTGWSVCSFDKTQSCLLQTYPITMSVPSGGKGGAPLASPITFTDDLSPDVFYGPGTTSSAAWTAAGANATTKYAPRFTECGGGQYMFPWALPNATMTVAGATTDNSVRNSGTMKCTQSAPGQPVSITVTGTDTTAYTVPSTDHNGNALDASLGLIISLYIRVEVPLQAVKDLGIDDGGTWALNTHNNLTNLNATSVTGQPAIETDPANNRRDLNIRAERGGPGGITKAFVGITGKPGNTPASSFSPNPEFEGLPGAGTWRDGNTVAVKGQTVLSAVTYTRHGIPPNGDDSFLNTVEVCDTWDSTKLQLPETFTFTGATSTLIQRPSNGNPVWASYWGDGTPITSQTPRNMKVQYGYVATPGNGASSDCTNSGSTAVAWADSPADVPGATLVDGSWQGINRVRMSFTDIAPRATDYFQFNMAVALKVVSTDAVGTILPNWASFAALPKITTLDDVVSNAATQKSNSGYNASTTTGGTQGDRLILGKVSARLKKSVQNKTTGAWVSSGASYTAGDTVTYRLAPSIVADVDAGLFSQVYVEDCLPVDEVFVSSHRASGAAITPILVQSGAPAGSEITCPAGRTYIKWDLGMNEIGKTIDPVLYDAELLDTALPTSTTAPVVDYTNTALVSSPDDGSSLAARTAKAQILVAVPSGIKISKSVDKGVIELNPGGATHPRKFTWTVTFANLNNPTTVANADVIDVLPANGLGGTSFHGTLTLNSVTVTTGTGAGLQTGAATNVTTLYTKSTPSTLNSDPTDATNAASGSTVWCSAADGTGTVVSGNGTTADCPSTMAQVTGLRFQRPGEFKPTDTLRAMITQTPADNRADDVYDNVTSGNATGVSQPVGPASRTVTVIGSSLGDTVWRDTNRNGLQDAGEPGVAGFAVKLSGTDVDGNTISATTTTNASGKYLFDNLPSGSYVVTFAPASLPAGTAFTTQKVGTNDKIDSDGDATTGVTGTITLGANTADLDVDQGIIEKPGALTWTKTDQGGSALAGSSWTLTGPSYPTGTTVADNGPLDADPADGAFKVTGLDWGSYTLTEATAPTGYQLDTTSHPATVDGSHLAVDLGAIKDAPIPGEIVWTKTDGHGYPLAGSEWTLTGPSYPTGTTIVDNDPLDADPADGALKVTGLDWGSYTLTESTAPTGYTPSSTTYTAVLDATHLSIDVGAIANTPIPGDLTWSKTDAGGAALAGSEWTLTGPSYPTGTTVADNGPLDADPADGALKVTGLDWGSYTLTETTAPTGYVLDPTVHTVSIGATALHGAVGAIVNAPTPGSVTWTKSDPSGKALAGSVWSLTGPGGYAATITDNGSGDEDPAAGAFKVSGLAWGSYTLSETKAPAGYIKATGSRTVTIDATTLATTFGPVTNSKVVVIPLKNAPTITTRTSAARVTVGSPLRDKITLRNFTAGGTSQGTVRLYGPYASRAAATCQPAKLVATRHFTPRNGTQTSPAVTVKVAGYYTWVASTSADAKNEATTHRCGLASETTLVHKPTYGHPIVEAGYSGIEYSFIRDVARTVASAVNTARLSYQAIGAKATATPVGISRNKVEIPSNVATLGIIGRSAGLGDVVGTTVIVGHVSDKYDRAGAFYKLSKAKRGQIISVVQGGTTYRFKVTSTSTYSRKAGAGVPTRFFSTTGAHRLVLISCTGKVQLGGGRFHYTRNQVVVAKPIK